MIGVVECWMHHWFNIFLWHHLSANRSVDGHCGICGVCGNTGGCHLLGRCVQQRFAQSIVLIKGGVMLEMVCIVTQMVWIVSCAGSQWSWVGPQFESKWHIAPSPKPNNWSFLIRCLDDFKIFTDPFWLVCWGHFLQWCEAQVTMRCLPQPFGALWVCHPPHLHCLEKAGQLTVWWFWAVKPVTQGIQLSHEQKWLNRGFAHLHSSPQPPHLHCPLSPKKGQSPQVVTLNIGGGTVWSPWSGSFCVVMCCVEFLVMLFLTRDKS